MSHIDPEAIQVAATSEARLQAFCEGVLALLKSTSNDSELSQQVTAGFLRAFEDGRSFATFRLKRQIEQFEAAATQLRRLSASNQMPFGDEIRKLVEKIDALRLRASNAVGLLEKLTKHYKASVTSPRSIQESVIQGADPRTDPESASVNTAMTGATVDEILIRSTLNVDESSADNKSLQPGHDHIVAARLERGSVHLKDGKAKLARGHSAEALADLNQAVALCRDALSYRWRGDAFASIGNWTSALSDYDASLERRPGDFGTCYNRAVVLRLSGQLNRSLKEFDKLVEQRTDHGKLYLNRGLIYLERNRPELARSEFEKTLKLSPTCREAQEKLNQINERQNAQIAEKSLRLNSGTEQTRSHAASFSTATTKGSFGIIPAQTDLGAQAERSPTVERSIVAADGCMIDFECPHCHESSAFRWDKMDRGKIISCPKCDKNFSMNSQGHYIEVTKRKDGKWITATKRKSGISYASPLSGWIVAVSILIVVVGAPAVYRSSLSGSTPPSDAALPAELDARAELFAQAWLRNDSSTMRRLTDPAQDRQLFPWRRRNPSPTDNAQLSDGCPCTIEVLQSTPSSCTTRIRFDDRLKTARRGSVELRLSWGKREGNWLFQPIGPMAHFQR